MRVWGYMLKTLGKEGRQDVFLNFFYHYFFSIQRAYGTLKENLLKFIYTQVINLGVKPSRSP